MRLFMRSNGFSPHQVKPCLPHLLTRSAGFTLLEILIAIVILSIALLALAALMATTTQNNSFGGHITEAATFAQDQLEQLLATPWDGIADGGNTISGSTGIGYTRNWVVATNDDGNLRTITITINWTDQVPRSISLTSVIHQ
jgi:type IV pilus assembly protein PilV